MFTESAYSTLQFPLYTGKNIADCVALIVDDDEASRLLLSSILSDTLRCICISNSIEVVAAVDNFKPDIIVMDINMPGQSGIDICKQLQSKKATANCPVLFVSSANKSEEQDRCWQVGASTLTYRVKHLLQSKLRLDLLTELTFKDSLTGLYNRHYLFTEIPTIFKQVVREQQFLSVIMVDIDRFKRYNDFYGHVKGDECLHEVAQTLLEALQRPQDCIIRYGGEEFLIFLPDTTAEGCLHVAQTLVQAVRDQKIPHEKSEHGVVTISVGYVVTKPTKESRIEHIVSEADLSLFEAKESGRCQLRGHANLAL
ncbi:GGDEF domain-containing response regulator [Alteromonas lipolytica]|uniref:diguanylate cyclase n=1 Tax=Alteromonas lipolytica TaxID=1856405 RepID=A0A1E8F956_9ALTE|nr:diguanylate cyclase [Alteromonas lipolytica]OFI32306.1 hypothetical protein BFC17_07595 [Alteromonas lipolytica]GGF85618.1 diguanylate cyclase response regulator [Alteromonas lipolytica]